MKKHKGLPAVLDRYEQYALLKQPNPKAPTGLRNLCIISLMLKTGLRVNEIINLKNEDIDWDNGRLYVRSSGAAMERVLWVDEAEISLLRKWQETKGTDSEHFFSTLDGCCLKDRYIREMVKRLARKAGITKDVYPHLLRHTFAVDLARETKDIHVLQEALGHREASATQIYSKLLIEELREPYFSDSTTRRSGMPVTEIEQKRFNVVEKTVWNNMVATEEAEQELVELPKLPETIKSKVTRANYDSNVKTTEANNNKPDSDNNDENVNHNSSKEEEMYKDVQEPRIEIVSESSETIRKPIPAIKCSQCNFILRFQGDCPQCGAQFDTIISHWRKNF
ncbi:MAG TPA: tyrosine-type recombinase/integrase [Bacteroidales bacterium]|nr:tyrosine-type recombinase/integrase [Bacteroidales bacterium]